MQYEEAKKLIEDTFENDFDKERFKRFVVNLLKNPQSTAEKTWENNYVLDAYKKYIEYYQRIVRFEDAKKRKLDSLIVFVKDPKTFEKARTRQRNFVLEYIKKERVDGVLVAYVHSNKEDWRFSFVKLETDIEKDETGKIKDIANITPAKRSSFLVGKNEKSHTAKKQFLPIIKIEESPSFEDIENAFNIETVTNEFFEKYRELFHRVDEILQKELENKPKIKEEFEKKEIASSDFAKKLLGQIVFLYFLQKKGWFGVKPKEEWGTGRKKFLRELFERREKYGKNFFKDLLEPIFYEALAQDRGTDAIYKKLNNCRMPFLNGGLFEPMHGYTWETTEIYLPDELFSNNEKTKEGDLGNGILDVFDRYNFTVNESDPLEKEVAVDPEMLGKVFEKLLDVKDRKSKGAFYTPREIVHYMCQECLVNYLDTETGDTVLREDIEFVIRNGESIIQNDWSILNRANVDEGEELKTPKTIRENARLLDDLLKNIKVCDPAVGSGAFPLGMINEIVSVRQVLQVYLNDKLSTYDFKLHAISKSIYGVDIDPGSVEIARLRLWLSLVVEEDEPSPLPNFEYKIMQGNSLLSEYEGIKLFDDSFLEDSQQQEKENNQIKEKLSLLQREYFDLHAKDELTLVKKTEIEKEIKLLQNRFKNVNKEKEIPNTSSGLFDITDKQKKRQGKTILLQKKVKEFVNKSQGKEKLKEEIEILKWELIEETLREQGKENKLEDIKMLRRKNIRPFFIWKLEFSDVFKEKGGFDVVIGNPPYVKEYTDKNSFKLLKQSPYYMGKMDLWYFFACYGLDILYPHGIQSFIAPNNWITNYGAKIMRDKFLDESLIHRFIDFGNYKVFSSAGIQTMVYLLEKSSNNQEYNVKYGKLKKDNPTNRELEHFLNSPSEIINEVFEKFECKFLKREYKNKNISFLHPEIKKIVDKIKSGGNRCLKETEVAQGIVIPQDKLNRKNSNILGDGCKVGEGIFVLSEKERQELDLVENEEEILKPYYDTTHFCKYSTKEKSNNWIIYTDSRFKNTNLMKEFPNIKKHLDKFAKIITSDNKPYGLHRAREERFFQGEKIVVPRKSAEPTFSFNEGECYLSATFYIIKPLELDIKYLLGLLNSSLVKFWLKYQGKMQGNNYQIDKEPLLSIPIKNPFIKNQKRYIEIFDNILMIMSSLNYNSQHPPKKQKDFEKDLDVLVYKLYGLTDKEIKFVEEDTNE